MAATWAAIGISAVGTILGYNAGKEQDKRFAEMAEQQYQMDKLNYEFAWQEAQDAYTYKLEDIDIAEWNLEQERTYRNAKAVNEWIDKDKQRMFDYNNQVDAYNASVGAYETQLNFNTIADELATHSSRLGYQDMLTKMGYQLDDLTISRDKVERKIGIQLANLHQKRESTIKTTRISKDILRQNLVSKKKELALKLEQQQLAGLEAEGKAKSVGRTGRSARKNQIALLAKSNRLEAAIQHSMNSSRERTKLDMQALNAKLESLCKQLDIENVEILNDLYNTQLDQEFATRQLNDQLRSENAAYNAREQKQKLDKYGADISAKGMLAAGPILAPELSKPLQLPEPKIQKPRAPRKGPVPRKYASATGHGMAALGSGMASLGVAVAGLADG